MIILIKCIAVPSTVTDDIKTTFDMLSLDLVSSTASTVFPMKKHCEVIIFTIKNQLIIIILTSIN